MGTGYAGPPFGIGFAKAFFVPNAAAEVPAADTLFAILALEYQPTGIRPLHKNPIGMRRVSRTRANRIRCL